MSQIIVDMGTSTQTVTVAESTKEILSQLESRKMVTVTYAENGETRHYAAHRVAWVTDDGSAKETPKEASK